MALAREQVRLAFAQLKKRWSFSDAGLLKVCGKQKPMAFNWVILLAQPLKQKRVVPQKKSSPNTQKSLEVALTIRMLLSSVDVVGTATTNTSESL
jgi:hypothetical protein